MLHVYAINFCYYLHTSSPLYGMMEKDYGKINDLEHEKKKC